MAKRLIISIDGGGIRGIIPLVILRSIQYRLKKNLNEISTSWYGTSTGSIIAAGLLTQQEKDFSVAIQNILDIYEFRSASSINPFGTTNPARALNILLEENFSSFEFKEFPKLNIVSCQLPDLKSTVFNSQNNVPMVDAVKASCAVPGIFEAVQIGNKKYIDGFVTAKNPAHIAIQNELLNDDLILLSLGTGILKQFDDIEKQVRQTHLDLELLSKEKGFHYFRMNPHLVLAADDMQNTTLKNIFSLKKDAENFMKEKEGRFEELVGILGGI